MSESTISLFVVLSNLAVGFIVARVTAKVCARRERALEQKVEFLEGEIKHERALRGVGRSLTVYRRPTRD